ncbi:MAG: DNA recombination protein RmuC [Bacteroidetes bacterium]|nr:DNA recombination protein RmuC [Bacteroidota bacterium]
MDILFLIVGITIGVIISYLYFKAKHTTNPQSNEDYQILLTEKTKLEERATAANTLKQELEKKNSELLETTSLLSEWKTKYINTEEKLTKQKQELEELNNRFTKEFENLANKIFEEKSLKFTEQNRNNLDTILSPLKEKIKDFEEKVDKTYKAESAERITLKTEIKNLVDLNKQISLEANNLATALKGNNKMQGNWGEVILEKILERSGLIKDEEYKTQYSTENNEGKRIQPDVVVLLPDNKHIIIDSKVSLIAYEALVNSTEDEEKQKLTKAHIESLKAHIKGLNEKNYQSSPQLSTPDFVLLFIPIESSFSMAIQADQELFNFAWDRKIVLVSPSTLLATLKTISSIWKQEKQTRNAIQIAEEGGKLYDKFVNFVEDLISVGKKMDEAKKGYSDAMSKLHEGTGNLVKRAENMKKLGAKTTKQLPTTLIERANENE